MIKILYHKNCSDGFGAAWVAHKIQGNDAEYIPCNYGEPLPELGAEDMVFMVDFSYPRDITEKIATQVKFLRVIDHHKTAQAALMGLPYATFDMNKSGAMLAWEYWHVDAEPPKLIEYIQDRDLWKQELPNCNEITYFIRSQPQNFERWEWLEHILENDFERCVDIGEGIVGLVNQQVQRAIERARLGMVGLHSILVTNETNNFSEVAGELAKLNEAHGGPPFGAAYFDRADGKRQWSLRSIGDFDVSEIAKALGGGGHKNAAGFVEIIT